MVSKLFKSSLFLMTFVLSVAMISGCVTNEGGNKSLIDAISTGNMEQIDKLIDKEPDFNRMNYSGELPLTTAVSKEKTEIVRKLLATGKVDINKTNSKGATPLLIAIRSKNFNMVVLLIKAGANINTPDSKSGETPLLVAIQDGNTEFVKYLLENGANVNLAGKVKGVFAYRDAFPLEVAIKNPDSHEILDILLNQDIMLNQKLWKGNSYLHLAVEYEESDRRFITKLIDKIKAMGTFDVNSVNDDGFTPLFYVKTKKIFDQLLSIGADITITNKGRNLLFYIDNEEIGRFLIEKGLDPNTEDTEGYTPIFFARNGEYLKLLLKNNVDPYKTFNNKFGVRFPAKLILLRGGDLKALLESDVDVNHQYGEEKVTLAHFLINELQENIAIIKKDISTDSGKLGAVLDATGKRMAKESFIYAINGIFVALNNGADFSIPDASGKSAFKLIEDNLLQEFVNSFPFEEKTSSPYIIAMMSIYDNRWSNNISIEETSLNWTDPFLLYLKSKLNQLPVDKETVSFSDVIHSLLMPN